MNRRSAGIWLVALLSLAPAAAAQYPDGEVTSVDPVTRLYLDEVVVAPQGREGVELYVRAETRYGEPVQTLRAVDLEINDNTRPIERDSIALKQLVETDRGAAAVIVLDRSARTGADRAFDRVRQAVERVVRSIRDVDRIAVIAFSDRPETVASWNDSREVLIERLQALEVAGEGDASATVYDATRAAIDLLRDDELVTHRGFVIVYTGGPDAGSESELETLIELGRGMEDEPRLPIFTISYTGAAEDPGTALHALSEGTAAKSFHARSTIHLSSLFQEIWRQMVESYVVFYPAPLDGDMHKIEISVEDHSDVRMVQYPSGRTLIVAWWTAAVLLVVLTVALVVRIRRRNRLMGRLVFVGGQESGREVILRGPDVRIGALPDNDIVVGSGAVSRKHAVLRLRGNDVVIEDLQTRNGTYVNGSPITKTTLKPGDKIRMADVDVVYEK